MENQLNIHLTNMEVEMRKIIKITNDIGSFMKEARERSGMTQFEVAKKSGYTTQTLSNIEQNKNSVNVNTLLAICTSIGVKVELHFEDRQNIKLKELPA